MSVKTGGCQCGRVRYSVETDKAKAYLCHCRMCQRATGGFAAALVQVPPGSLIWESEPDWYESSPIARRPFCAKCGTPLGFHFLDGAGEPDISLGSLDEPASFTPEAHAGSESIHEAWLNTSALPRYYTAKTESIARRWRAAGREVPE